MARPSLGGGLSSWPHEAGPRGKGFRVNLTSSTSPEPAAARAFSAGRGGRTLGLPLHLNTGPAVARSATKTWEQWLGFRGAQLLRAVMDVPTWYTKRHSPPCPELILLMLMGSHPEPGGRWGRTTAKAPYPLTVTM